MLEEKLISVIVPIFNVEKYLERCVNSIQCHSYKNIEIILVDDGSSDGSELICDSFARKDNRVKTIHQANSGVATARNKGLDISICTLSFWKMIVIFVCVNLWIPQNGNVSMK